MLIAHFNRNMKRVKRQTADDSLQPISYDEIAYAMDERGMAFENTFRGTGLHATYITRGPQRELIKGGKELPNIFHARGR